MVTSVLKLNPPYVLQDAVPRDSQRAWQRRPNSAGTRHRFANRLGVDCMQTATRYVAGGNYLRKFALGPQITYYLTPAAAIVLKWQRELEVTNGPKGDRVWLEFAFPLGG